MTGYWLEKVRYGERNVNVNLVEIEAKEKWRWILDVCNFVYFDKYAYAKAYVTKISFYKDVSHNEVACKELWYLNLTDKLYSTRESAMDDCWSAMN